MGKYKFLNLQQGSPMYTREEFESRRTAVKRIEKREGRVLAAVSVRLGLAQLVFIRWAEAHLTRKSQVPIEGGAGRRYPT